MKKVTRSPFTWILLFLCALIAFLYFCGFRITYAPSLENSWDAISACAGWFGAIMSAGALLVAIHIPKVIAEQQNKIALFDRRYSAWDSLVFLIAVVKQIDDGTAKEIDKRFFLDTIIKTYKSISIVGVISADCNNPSDVYVRLIFEAGKIAYLFKIEEIEIIIDFLKTVDQYISDIYKNKSADEAGLRAAYTKLVGGPVQEKIEAQLII